MSGLWQSRLLWLAPLARTPSASPRPRGEWRKGFAQLRTQHSADLENCARLSQGIAKFRCEREGETGSTVRRLCGDANALERARQVRPPKTPARLAGFDFVWARRPPRGSYTPSTRLVTHLLRRRRCTTRCGLLPPLDRRRRSRAVSRSWTSRSSPRLRRRLSWRAACRSSISSHIQAARSRSTCPSRRRRPRRALRRSSSRRSTAPMVRGRLPRTSWTSRGGRRVPLTSRSLIWPARRVLRRRPYHPGGGRHRLLCRRSIESSRCCLLYPGRRHHHRLPGARRLRLRRRPVRGRRRHRLRCRRGWCKCRSRARKHTFLSNWYPGLQHSVQRLQCRPYIAFRADCNLPSKILKPADTTRKSHATSHLPHITSQQRPKTPASGSKCCAAHSYNARQAFVLRASRTLRCTLPSIRLCCAARSVHRKALAFCA